MKLIEVRETLEKLNQPAFSLQDIIGILQIEKTNASQIMNRLVEVGSVVKLKRGLWTWPKMDPFVISAYLTAPLPSYVSLQSALFYHGVIDQIPAFCYVVTLGRKQIQQTPLGTFSIHHMNVNFFNEYETHYDPYYQLATPEKALLDYFYLGRFEACIFGKLPELDITNINSKKMRQMIDLIDHSGIKTHIILKLKKCGIF